MKSFRAWMMAALCVVLAALTACSSGSSYVRSGYNFNSVGKVAVIVSMNVGSPAQQQEVADLFAMQVLRKGYDVIDRANIADLANEAAFQTAVDEVTAISTRLLRSLETSAPPKNREEEAAKAKARSAERYGT